MSLCQTKYLMEWCLIVFASHILLVIFVKTTLVPISIKGKMIRRVFSERRNFMNIVCIKHYVWKFIFQSIYWMLFVLLFWVSFVSIMIESYFISAFWRLVSVIIHCILYQGGIRIHFVKRISNHPKFCGSSS